MHLNCKCARTTFRATSLATNSSHAPEHAHSIHQTCTRTPQADLWPISASLLQLGVLGPLVRRATHGGAAGPGVVLGVSWQAAMVRAKPVLKQRQQQQQQRDRAAQQTSGRGRGRPPKQRKGRAAAQKAENAEGPFGLQHLEVADELLAKDFKGWMEEAGLSSGLQALFK